MLPKWLLNDEDNIILTTAMIHGHIDGPSAQGDLVAVLKPHVASTYQERIEDDLFRVELSLCYHKNSGDLHRDMIRQMKEGTAVEDLQSEAFPHALRTFVWVQRPVRFVFCAVWKFREGLQLLKVNASDLIWNLDDDPEVDEDFNNAIEFFKAHKTVLNDPDYVPMEVDDEKTPSD